MISTPGLTKSLVLELESRNVSAFGSIPRCLDEVINSC